VTTYPDIRSFPSGTITLNPSATNAPVYALINMRGDIVDVSSTRDEVIAAARRAGGTGVHFDDDEKPSAEPTKNPAGDDPHRALERGGLEPLDFDRVIRIDLEDAWKALLPYFTLLRRKGSEAEIKSYKTPEGMAARFLGQNYKTGKGSPPGEDPGSVMGLSMLPADRLTVKYLSDLDPDRNSLVHVAVKDLLRKSDRAVSTADAHERLPPQKRRAQWTMCDGSTDECKNSCIAYTGHQDVYNNRRRAVGTLALIEYPDAFCRMLIEAIRMHTRSESCHGLRPFVRLNVMSDVPWELLIPGLFDYFSPENYGRRLIKSFGAVAPPVLYDYTKLANRTPPPNYDLTFSFSGKNAVTARAEMARGHRVAVVFLAMKPKNKRGDRWAPFRHERGVEVELPETFWGAKVADGDVSDFRPYDPPNDDDRNPCIVGLRWKPPAGQGIDPTDPDFMFATRSYYVAGDVFPEEQIAQAQYLRELEYLTVPVTPRHQPIDENPE
jgi:hypothetical protein